MSSLHAAVHAQTASQRSLVDVVKELKSYMTENRPASRSVTLFYAELDPLTGSLSFINAGHNPPIIAHADGSPEQLSVGSVPLGIWSENSYQEGHAQLRPGDVLVAYPDSVTEAENPTGEVFGAAHSEEIIRQNHDRSAAGIRDRIEVALSAFAQGTPAVDDITLLIVRQTGREG